MNNELMVFEGMNVEIFEFEGKVLFNPRHVGEALGMSHSSLRNHLAEMNGNKKITLTNSNVRLTDFRKLANRGETFVTESGVYDLIFKSRKADAIRFKDWVTDEVLPSIRKHGAYMTENTLKQVMGDPDFMIGLLTNLKQEQEKRIAAEKINEVNKPKVESFDMFIDASNYQNMNEVAKSLGIGRNKLFEFLRNEKVLMSKSNNNVPYQSYITRGYFTVKETTVNKGGYNRNVVQTHVTSKGVDFISKLISKKGIVL